MSDYAPLPVDTWGNIPLPDDPPEDTTPIGPPGGFPADWRLLDDVQVMALPDPEYLVAGLIPRRGVGSVYGPSGTGKTTFVAQLCTAVATTRAFFGHPVCHRAGAVNDIETPRSS